MTTQNLWDAAKAVLGGKFIAMLSNSRNKKKRRIENLTLHLQQLQKEEQQQKKPKLVEGKKASEQK